MSFIVQISLFVHLFTLKIVFRMGNLPPEPPSLMGALSGPQTPRRKLCLHFSLYLATPLYPPILLLDMHDRVIKAQISAKYLGIVIDENSGERTIDEMHDTHAISL